MKSVFALLVLCAGFFCCAVYTPPPTKSAEAQQGKALAEAAREGDAVTGAREDTVPAGTAAFDSEQPIQIARLESKIRELEKSHRLFFTYYMWLTATILTGAFILIVLNARESRRKDRIIYNSEQFLQHSMQVQEAERKRISLDLHDSIAQGLRYVSLLAENLQDRDAAQKIIAVQNENIESIRRLCYNLTPPAITESNLIPSLILLGQKIFDTGSSDFQFRVASEPAVSFEHWDENALMNLYRIVQEALQNIQKHAQAGEATVFFKGGPANGSKRNGSKRNGSKGGGPGSGALKVIITDDGCGMDAGLVARLNDASFEHVENLHFGLRNIFERAKLLGGKVTYFSEEGCGTRLTVEI